MAPHDGLTERGRTARAELAEAARALCRNGLIGVFGHVSALDPDDPERFLIHPGAGARKDLLTGADVLSLPMTRPEWRRELPLELFIHAEVHRRRPDVACVVHVHSPALRALSILEEPPSFPVVLQSAFWPEPPPVFEEPDLIRDVATAARYADRAGDAPLALLRWHGAVLTGASIAEGVFRSVEAEINARAFLDARVAGSVAPIPREARARADAAINNARLLDLYWNYERSFVREGESE